MTGRKKFSSRLTALFLAVVLLVTPIMQVPAHAEGTLSKIANSALVTNLGKIAPAVKGVTAGIEFASKVYDAVEYAMDAEDGQGFKAFLDCFMGKIEEPSMSDIANTLNDVNGKIDSISASVDELSGKVDIVLDALNGLSNQLGEGIDDLKVQLYDGQMQMQNWTKLHDKIEQFYSKYSNVRGTLQDTITTLNNRAADYEVFIAEIDKLENADEIHAVLAKLDAEFSNYDSLSDAEKTLLSTTVTVNGSSTTVYSYAKNYVDYVHNLLETTYSKFTSDYEIDMYNALTNMGSSILGTQWQSEGQGGIGEIYYKLCMLEYSNSDQVHDAYHQFASGVQYDFLLTAYVCSMALRSQIATGTPQEVATAQERLQAIYDLIGHVMVYSEYEYDKCVNDYDFCGFQPDGSLSYDDFVVYYGNALNSSTTGVTEPRFVSKKSLSLAENLAASNQNMYLAAGESDQFKIWFNGEEVQDNYDLYSTSECVIVDKDGTVTALRPGTAMIRMMINGVLYDVAHVTVSSSYAKYEGNGTNEYVYYENGTKKTLTHPGEGYIYEYCSDISSIAVANGIDSSDNLNQILTNYITFEDGADLDNYEVILNHKYGQIKEADEFYLQFAHAYTGSVLLTKTVDGQTSVVVVPIKNVDRVAVEESDVTYTYSEDSDTYYIYTKEDLLNWREQYETNYTNAKTNVVLMNDIDFEWGEWSGLQYALVTKKDDPGKGLTNLYKTKVETFTFDGNGHTIKNITFVPTEVTMYTYGESKTERESQRVVTFGFFAKLAGTLKNLTIENVKYSGYPVTYDDSWVDGAHDPRILSVFASLADSEIHGYKYDSGDSETAELNWTSEVSNCHATGVTETVTTAHVLHYDPFGNMWDQMNGKTQQKITVKNCVYDMNFIFEVDNLILPDCCDEGTRYFSIFSSTESNIFAGNVTLKHVSGIPLPTDISFIRTEGMTDTQKESAKNNIRVLDGSSFMYTDISAYKLTTAESSNSTFWTERGWDANSVNRMLAGNSYPIYQGECVVDISNMKRYYHIGEELDTSNIVFYLNGEKMTNYDVDDIDTSTAGTKNVIVSFGGYSAHFTVEYVAFVPIHFTYNNTTYTYSAGTSGQFTLPDALFTRTDGYAQVGWYLQGSESGDPLPLGSSVTVTGTATYVPAWKQGDIITVTFGSGDSAIVFEVPEGAVITVPYPSDYNPKIYAGGSWIYKYGLVIDGKYEQGSVTASFGSSYTVTGQYATGGRINFSTSFTVPASVPYKVSVYYQNLNDDDYTFLGAYEGYTFYGQSFNSVYHPVENKFGIDITSQTIVDAQGVYCDEYDLSREPYYWYKIGAYDEPSHLTIWVDRNVYTVTWQDFDGNTVKTESFREGGSSTPPADEDCAPAGYAPVWEKSGSTYDIVYKVVGYTPLSGIEYTVNHMWQNVDDDEYTLHESETLTGTTEDDTAAVAKDYTGFTAQTITQAAIAGDGSTVVNVYYNRNEYTVTWDIEGTPTTETYRYGATPSWKGETPTKQSDGKYNYSFKSWGDIQPVTDNVTYTAQFDSHLNTFTITWDIDGVTTTEVYTWGDTPEYKGETPTREATAQYTYTFKNWGEITAVTGDKTYTAIFDATVNKYTITWVVEGDSFTEEYEYGATPFYKGTTPVKPSDETGSYTFNGWGQIETVTGDKTYTAQFISTASTYTITWDVNGEKLTELYTYGDIPSYKGVTPVKPATAQYSYTFAGWGEITEVTGNKTYTAQFTETVNKYTITWNIDGNQVTEEYEYGATPSYKGTTPTREADAQYTYSFRDWGTILTVAGDKTYTATFNTTVNKYNITWIIDGVQFTESYDYGAMPAYKGYTPTKDATAQYTYTFAGWGEIVKVTGNKTYTAIFDSTVNKYTITWVIDGTEITEEYEYGAMPSYKGEAPTRAGNAQYTYTFKGWGSVLSVTGDKTYTAQFTETVNKYTITWVVNGVETTEEYEYGAVPSYKGETPTKDGDAQVEYTFTGWGEISAVTGDATYTAQFSKTDKTYTITWVVDGQQTEEQYKYGETPSYKGGTPRKENTAQYTYTFEGWGEITTVTGNKTYTAVFTSTVNKYTITWNIEGVLTEEEYEYGKTPSYKGATPSKDATAQYTYTFKDWGEITDVTADKTYTANFAATVNKYTITWVVNDEQFTEEYEYGATPVYKGYKPTKPSTEQYTYEFSGWGEITKVTGDKTYTAAFNAIYIVPDEITSSTYNVGENTISKIAAGTSSKEFIEAINESQYCKVLKGDSIVSDDTTVGTGMTVDIVDGDKTNASYTIIVTGDTNGDGNITITDMLAIKAHVLGKTELTGAYAVAADTNGDGAITITDFLQLKAQLLGKGDIEAR